MISCAYIDPEAVNNAIAVPPFVVETENVPPALGEEAK